ncbi:MAG: hypothetical protein ACK583_09620 [Cyanobacteriota bacterium]
MVLERRLDGLPPGLTRPQDGLIAQCVLEVKNRSRLTTPCWTQPLRGRLKK